VLVADPANSAGLREWLDKAASARAFHARQRRSCPDGTDSASAAMRLLQRGLPPFMPA
jgi:hypothetical protein